MDRATGLIERVLENPGRSDLDNLANELLSEYYRGSDLSSLRNLLHSEDHRIVACGAWIASELGEMGKPLLHEVKRLLGHPSKTVRFWAIECLQEWAGPSNPEELAFAISLVGDSDEAVRWKAMGFLALAPRAQLEDALVGFATTGPGSPDLDELRWGLGPEGADPAKITDALEDPSSRRRKFAAAAAFRVAKDNTEPLRRAASSTDTEIAQFAGDMLKRISGF